MNYTIFCEDEAVIMTKFLADAETIAEGYDLRHHVFIMEISTGRVVWETEKR